MICSVSPLFAPTSKWRCGHFCSALHPPVATSCQIHAFGQASLWKHPKSPVVGEPLRRWESVFRSKNLPPRNGPPSSPSTVTAFLSLGRIIRNINLCKCCCSIQHSYLIHANSWELQVPNYIWRSYIPDWQSLPFWTHCRRNDVATIHTWVNTTDFLFI